MKKTLENLYKNAVRSCKNHLGNRDYRKFVVVARSRTGSTFLRYSLKSHPNIVSHDEPFNRLEGSTCLQIWNNTFSREYSWTKCVGFKIFYYHPNDSDDQEIWELIKRDKEIRIIHLKRENMLRTYVSKQIAKKSGVWKEIHSKQDMAAEAKCVEIDLDDCLEEFARIQNWESDTQTNFRDHPYIEVRYEDLVADNAGTMNIIFDFLEVPRREVKSRVIKQNPEELQQLVSNYEELERTLSMAGFDRFLDSD